MRVSHLHFALFDSAPTPDDTLPPAVSSSLLEAGEAWTVARRVAVGINPAWLVASSDDRLCLVQLIYPVVSVVNRRSVPPITSTTCASENEAAGGNLLVTDSLIAEVGARERNLIVGIVPDGVSVVKVRETDGQVFTVRVSRNAYEALIGHPQSVGFVYKTARHVVPVKSFSSKGHYQAPAKEAF